MHNGFNGWPFKFTMELYKNLQLLPLCSLGGTYFPIQPKNDKLAICTHSRRSCIFVGHVFITTKPTIYSKQPKLEKKFRQFFFKVQFVNDKEINVVINDSSKRRWIILCMSSKSPLIDEWNGTYVLMCRRLMNWLNPS